MNQYLVSDSQDIYFPQEQTRHKANKHFYINLQLIKVDIKSTGKVLGEFQLTLYIFAVHLDSANNWLHSAQLPSSLSSWRNLWGKRQNHLSMSVKTEGKKTSNTIPKAELHFHLPGDELRNVFRKN